MRYIVFFFFVFLTNSCHINSKNPNANCQIQVTTKDGHPLEGVIISIAESEGKHRDIAAMTNASGEFDFKKLEKGQYTLLFNKEGYTLKYVPILLNQDTMPLKIVLESL